MSGGPFPRSRIARLEREAARTDDGACPPQLVDPILIDAHGAVLLPVPDRDPGLIVDRGGARRLTNHTRRQLHPGVSVQWAPWPGEAAALVSVRAGEPDGDPRRDHLALYLTSQGIRRLAADLIKIADTLEADA